MVQQRNNRRTTGNKTAGKKPVRKTPAKRKTTKKKDSGFKVDGNKLSLILLGLSLVVILTVVGTLMFMPVKGPETAEKPEQKKEKKAALTIDIVHKNIVSTVTDNGYKKNSILSGGNVNNTYSYLIKAKTEDIEKIKNTLSSKLQKIGMFVVKGKTINADGPGFSARIAFKSTGTAVVSKPEPVKKPVNFKGPKMAIVIDDCGYSIPLANKLAALKYPVTFAIIPHTPHDRDTAAIARKSGKTVFLHQPMQPMSYPKNDPGKGGILMSHTKPIIEGLLAKNMEEIGKIDGFNNHMGSAITQDKTKMTQILSYMKRYTNVFFDSKTSSKTVGYDTCIELGMKCALNNTYLDNSNEAADIEKMVSRCAAIAKRNGQCIIIGHLRPNTVKVLHDYLPKVEKEGVKVVSILDLVR